MHRLPSPSRFAAVDQRKVGRQLPQLREGKATADRKKTSRGEGERERELLIRFISVFESREVKSGGRSVGCSLTAQSFERHRLPAAPSCAHSLYLSWSGRVGNDPISHLRRNKGLKPPTAQPRT